MILYRLNALALFGTLAYANLAEWKRILDSYDYEWTYT
jgi:hypothetical protein